MTYLSIRPDVLKKTRNPAITLREMVRLPQRITNRLQDLLVILRLRLLYLGRSTDVILQIAAHMLPSPETFDEEVCRLYNANH